MIALARRRAPRAVFRTGTIARAALPACKAVTAFGECFNYRQAGAPPLRALFARVHRALARGGLFLFDVREPARAVSTPVVHRLGRDWAVLARVTARRRNLTRVITTFRRVGRDYRRSDEVHRLRLYPRADVRRALLQAGFTVSVRRSLGGLPLAADRIAFLARRH
jgi:hypothetical protein